MSAWSELASRSAINSGNAWEHLMAQGGGGSDTVVYLEAWGAELSDLQLSVEITDDVLTASVTEDSLSATIQDEQLQGDFEIEILEGWATEDSLSGEIQE